MDPVENPYAPGAGVRPPELAGRTHDIAAFETLLARATRGRSAQGLVLTGLRGVGKTVLLGDLAARARRRNWIVAQFEARPDRDGKGSFRLLLARSLNQSLRQLVARAGPLRSRLRPGIRTFKSFSIRTDPSGRLALGIDADPHPGRADTGHLDLDVPDLALDLAASASDAGGGVLVLVDEMQALTGEEFGAVCTALQETGQSRLPFLVVGAGLPTLPGLLAGARSYAERMFACRAVGPLPDEAAALAVKRPAERHRARWSPRAVEVVVDAACGHPYFLQEFAKASWDFAAGPTIQREDALVGVQAGRDQLDAGFYRNRWSRATPTEREYLRAMAADGEGPSSSGEVARRLGKRSVQEVGPTRARLIDKGLVYAPERGSVAYTVPGMGGFVSRQAGGPGGT